MLLLTKDEQDLFNEVSKLDGSSLHSVWWEEWNVRKRSFSVPSFCFDAEFKVLVVFLTKNRFAMGFHRSWPPVSALRRRLLTCDLMCGTFLTSEPGCLPWIAEHWCVFLLRVQKFDSRRRVWATELASDDANTHSIFCGICLFIYWWRQFTGPLDMYGLNWTRTLSQFKAHANYGSVLRLPRLYPLTSWLINQSWECSRVGRNPDPAW